VLTWQHWNKALAKTKSEGKRGNEKGNTGEENRKWKTKEISILEI
jgi:hypothetical protein